MTNTLSFRTAILSLAVLAFLAVSPLSVSADTTATASSETSVGVIMSPNNMLHVFGATVSALSGSVINATAKIGNTVMNWIINIGPETKLFVDGSANASTTALAVGDTINFHGTLVATTSAATVVDAKRVKDTTQPAALVRLWGSIQDISTTAGTFLLVGPSATTTVKTNSDTHFGSKKDNGVVFSNLVNGETVIVVGTKIADGTVLATKVFIHNATSAMNWFRHDKDDDERYEVKTRGSGNIHSEGKDFGLFFGLGNALKINH